MSHIQYRTILVSTVAQTCRTAAQCCPSVQLFRCVRLHTLNFAEYRSHAGMLKTVADTLVFLFSLPNCLAFRTLCKRSSLLSTGATKCCTAHYPTSTKIRNCIRAPRHDFPFWSSKPNSLPNRISHIQANRK